MAPVRKNTIEHFTHQGHPLTYLTKTTQFLCDGCKIIGNGNRYRCSTCDFDLHEYCATCPPSLSSFMHPTHPLTLTVRKPQGARTVERVCDVCGTHVNGLFYRCSICEFDAHPLCTQLPQHARHPLHPGHVLRLQPQPGPLSLGLCSVCKTTCRFWGYRCGVCDFNIHFQCFIKNKAPAPAPAAIVIVEHKKQLAPPPFSVRATVSTQSRSTSGSGSSSVSGFVSRTSYNANRNLSLDQAGAGAGATIGNVVSDTIAYWVSSSTWLN